MQRIREGPRLDTKWAIGTPGVVGESPISEQTFSPYESKYNSPTSARRAPPGTMPFEWPLKSPLVAVSPVERVDEKKDFEMERVRPRNKWEQGEYDRRLAAEWAEEAASRGFTVSLPPRANTGSAFKRPDPESQIYFPPPPTKAKSPKPRK